MLDGDNILIGTVALGWLIMRLVQAVKILGLKGTRPILLTVFSLAVVFAALSQAMAEGLIPPVALPWIRVGVIALASGVYSIGEYELHRAKLGDSAK